MSQPRIAVVVHSLSHNNIGRVYPFLQAFAGRADLAMTLIGWNPGGALFALLRDLPWPIIQLSGPDTGPAAARALEQATRGCNLIHCFKNREHFPAALAVAHRHGVPLLLDLDDWELGLYLEGVGNWPAWRRLLSGKAITGRIRRALELEHLARAEPDGLVVSSGALQAHFGGELIPTAADAALFDPTQADGPGFRRARGIADDAPTIGFLGTLHPHKGVDDLLAAFEPVRARYPAARLLLGSLPARSNYGERLRGRPEFVLVGELPAADYRDAYAACDIVAIPQRAVTEGIMQLPAKLILAMASGRAVVATRVGDIPGVLGAAGLLVAPEQPAQLSAALLRLLGDPAERAVLGSAARARFLERYTLDQLRQRMASLYNRLIRGDSV